LSDDEETIDGNMEIDERLTAGVVRYDHNGSVIVNSLTYCDFRQRFVEHFDIMYRNNTVLWPDLERLTKSMLEISVKDYFLPLLPEKVDML
jgi:hypothetical protein